jgi:autotransporter adhesin
VCCLASLPALARDHAPSIHLMAATGARAVAVHSKSKPIERTITNVTETATFTGTISTAADYKKKTEIAGEAWFSGSCTEPATPKQAWKGLPKKTLYAKISTGTVESALGSGACPGDTFKFYTVIYDLSTKKAVGDTDSFTGTLTALKFLKVYDLYLEATFDLTIGS